MNDMIKENIASSYNVIMNLVQLVPIALISYFILHSIMYNSMSGIVLIIGIAISSSIAMFLGNTILSTPTVYKPSSMCNFISINHKTGLSSIPFSQTIFGFTLSYLTFTVIEYGQGIRNLFSLLLFASLIIADINRLIDNKCFPLINIIFGLSCSLIMGAVWGNILNNPKYKPLQYVFGQHELCMAPKRRNFKCTSSPESDSSS